MPKSLVVVESRESEDNQQNPRSRLYRVLFSGAHSGFTAKNWLWMSKTGLPRNILPFGAKQKSSKKFKQKQRNRCNLPRRRP